MQFFPPYTGPSLLDQIVSVENLTTAWRRVRSNIKLVQRPRSAGADQVTLHEFERDWTRQMAQLADELRDGSYRPLPARQIAIPKRSGGARAIAILAIRDRVAQRAVQQVLEPLFDPYFLDCAYGCRPGLGVPQAIARLERYAEQGFTWVVDADIERYFDTIDQRIALALVRQRVNEVAVLRLLRQWLDAGTLQTNVSDAPPAAHGLIGRARETVQRLIEQEEPPPVIPQHLPPDAMWTGMEADELPYGVPLVPRGDGWENKVWTGVMVARPVLRGARAALPYVQQLGARRLAMAGVVAAGAVAASEVALRALARDRRGTPQGSALSPLLANIYLHPFDLAVTSQGLRLVRFMDDFVIPCATEAEAQHALNIVQRQLARLRLTLNAEKTRIVPYNEGLDFLGHALAPRPEGTRIGRGLTTFAEAEQALRKAAGNARKRWRKE